MNGAGFGRERVDRVAAEGRNDLRRISGNGDVLGDGEELEINCGNGSAFLICDKGVVPLFETLLPPRMKSARRERMLIDTPMTH